AAAASPTAEQGPSTPRQELNLYAADSYEPTSRPLNIHNAFSSRCHIPDPPIHCPSTMARE
ncbi:MAG: hypothetical protein ABGZ35_06110, partial [Planctomycetaceae bacterium]